VGTTGGEQPYVEALDLAARRGVAVTCAGAGDNWESGGVRFEVLHPGMCGLGDEEDDPNAWSLVLKVTYGRRSILMTGDLTPAIQDSLVERGVDLGCDILKVPHHGHPGGTSEAFARRLRADFAVISCGIKYFDKPDSSTLELLSATGMRVFSTMSDGAVEISTDGRRLCLQTCLSGIKIEQH